MEFSEAFKDPGREVRWSIGVFVRCEPGVRSVKELLLVLGHLCKVPADGVTFTQKCFEGLSRGRARTASQTSHCDNGCDLCWWEEKTVPIGICAASVNRLTLAQVPGLMLVRVLEMIERKVNKWETC